MLPAGGTKSKFPTARSQGFANPAQTQTDGSDSPILCAVLSCSAHRASTEGNLSRQKDQGRLWEEEEENPGWGRVTGTHGQSPEDG